MEAFGRVPERSGSGFGAWLADSIWTEVRIRAGATKPYPEYTVLYNEGYKALAYLAQEKSDRAFPVLNRESSDHPYQ
eukprot:8270741-Heterocapsa_arctica.AAC.1